MTHAEADERGELNHKFPARDWILLPLLSLLTIVFLAFASEIIARSVFGTSKTGLDACLTSDASAGVRGVPNSICREKTAESELVEYRFDCSGYRNDAACGARAPDDYRIAMIGSSIAMGERVPIEKSLGALLPQELSRLSGRRVDLYNYSMAFGFPRNVALNFHEVLASKPNLVIWVLTAIDVKLADYAKTVSSKDQPALQKRGFLNTLKNKIEDKIGGNPLASTLTALQYFLQKYKTQDQYVHSYLTLSDGEEGDWDAGPGALKAHLSEEWKARLAKFDSYVAEVGKMAQNAGVPFVVAMVPNRAQAAMISMGEWPSEFDPYNLNKELHSIVARHGGGVVDILPDFRNTRNPEKYYYPIDGHPDADGHAVIAGFLAKELGGGAIPELRAKAQSDRSSEPGL